MSKPAYFSMFFLVLTLFFALSVQHPAQADTPWTTGDQLRARLLVGGPESPQAAIEVVLGEGWHSYWRAPGDAGLAPVFDWSKSVNLKEARILWPVPKRFDESGLTVFGYEETVMFPVNITLADTAKPATLALDLQIMVCRDICIPERLSLSANFPADQNAEGTNKRLEHAMRLIPVKEDTPHLKLSSVVLGPDALVVTASSKNGFKDADIFAVIDDAALTVRPEISVVDEKTGQALIRIPKPAGIDDLPAYMKGKILNLTLAVDGKAIEKDFSF